MTTPAPQLRHVCRITAELAPWVEVGPVDAERLVFVPITGGAVSGSISGKVLPGGGDWARIISSDHVAVEARYLMQTDDGIVIDVVNTGIARHVDGFDSPIGYFATRPVFRVSGDRLEWMNRSVFVGWATSTPAATTIDIYEIQPPDDED